MKNSQNGVFPFRVLKQSFSLVSDTGTVTRSLVPQNCHSAMGMERISRISMARKKPLAMSPLPREVTMGSSAAPIMTEPTKEPACLNEMTLRRESGSVVREATRPLPGISTQVLKSTYRK